jgi:predicted nucleotidyltransferase
MMADPSGDDSGLPLFDEVVAAFKKHQVEFMIIGGFAVVYHGHVRATEDLDLFIRRTEENARKAVAALKELSQGELDLTPDVFTAGKGVLIGERPLRVDILAEIAGVTFDDAWERRQTDFFGPAEVHFISREDLIANKRAAGRPKDLDDARALSAGPDLEL